MIDPITHNVIATIPAGSDPFGLAADPALRCLYVLDACDNTLSVIDGNTNTVVDTIPQGGCANCNCGSERVPAVNPNNHLVYVPGGSTGMVNVINGYDHSSVGAVFVGGNPTAAAVNPSTNLVYIANNTNSIPVINSNTNSLYTEINLPGPATVNAIAVDPCSNQIFAQRSDGSIAAINCGCNELETTFRPAGGANAIAIDQTLGLLYTIDSNRRVVDVCDTCTLKEIGTLPIPANTAARLGGLAVNSATHLVYVTDSGNNEVYIADGGLNSLVAAVPAGNVPYGAAVLACESDCPSCGGGTYGGHGDNNAAACPGIFTAIAGTSQTLQTGGFTAFSDVLLNEGGVALQQNPAHVQVQQAGLYELNYRIPVRSVQTGGYELRCALQVNGISVLEDTLGRANANGPAQQTAQGQFYARLNPSDIISVPVLSYTTDSPAGESIVGAYLALRRVC